MNRNAGRAPPAGAGRTARLARTLVRSEALKTRKRLAVWILLGIYVAAIAIVAILSATTPVASGISHLAARGWTRVPLAAPPMGNLCLGIGLALLVAAEFKWRTARQNVIDGLSKGEFFVGKLMLWAGLVAALLVAACVTGAASLLAFPPENGAVAPTAADLKAWVGLALSMGVWGGAAFFLASVVRAGGPAVGTLLGFFLLEGLARGVARTVATIKDWDFAHVVLDYSPGHVADLLGNPDLYYDAPTLMSAMQNPFEAFGSRPSFEAMAVAALAYVAAFAALAYANFRKRDL